MCKLIKTIDISMENYTETVKLWEHEDYYSLTYEMADCSVSGTLEEMKEQFSKDFKMELPLD